MPGVARRSRAIRPVVRLLPGLIAALGALLVVRLVAWAISFWLELAIFVGAYVLLALLVDAAFKRYAKERG